MVSERRKYLIHERVIPSLSCVPVSMLDLEEESHGGVKGSVVEVLHFVFSST